MLSARSSLPAASRARPFTAARPQGALRSVSRAALASGRSNHQCSTSTTASERGEALACKATPRNAVYLFGFGGGSQAPQDDDYVYEEETYTVAKLQVAIFGDVKGWQQKLDRLSSLYDTDDEDSLFTIFQESVTMLLRNTPVIGYATSAGKVFDNLDDAEAKFNQVSLEERGKFQEETLVNVDGRRRSTAPSLKAGDTSGDDWICVTLLMAVEGIIKIPKAQSIFELKKAMTALGAVNSDNLVAFELLWTPQEAGEAYDKDALLMDYPTMVNMS